MSFDHNDHYHRLLLRHLPPDCRTALDVGCGTGRFARLLAERGIEVDAVDPAREAIAAARAMAVSAGSTPPRFWHADLTRTELPRGHYDFVSCLASLHHMPFATVERLRDALAPGGVLVVLGCYPRRTPVDLAWELAAVPANTVARLVVAARETARGTRAARRGVVRAPVREPYMPLAEVRREAAALLPGAAVRRLLFWRFLLVFRNGAGR